MSPVRPLKLLLLGGTGEAVALARAITDQLGSHIALTTSLAGRTENPVPVSGALRVGGFGGIDGLRTYLHETRTDIVIDATHPFAAQISRHAAAAATSLGLPLLVLERPAWQKQPGDRWIDVEDSMAAAQALAPIARRVWLTIGTGDLAAFAALEDAWFLIRTIAAPEQPPSLAAYDYIFDRGPFSLAGERAVIRNYRIDALVTKASGGPATQAKLIAAREAGIPVVMLRRPAVPDAERADSVAAAIGWLERRLQNPR